MRNALRAAAALAGFSTIILAWGVFYYSRHLPIPSINGLDPLATERIWKQFLDLVGPVSEEIGSRFCEVSFSEPLPKKARLNRAVNIPVLVSLPDGVERCTSNVALLGAAFSIEPRALVKVSLDKTNPQQTVIFNMLPAQPGTQPFVYGYDKTAKHGEMKVYQYPYIDPDLSVWFPIIGTFFGGTLTLPWWLRLFGIPKKDKNDETRPQKRKEKRKGR